MASWLVLSRTSWSLCHRFVCLRTKSVLGSRRSEKRLRRCAADSGAFLGAVYARARQWTEWTEVDLVDGVGPASPLNGYLMRPCWWPRAWSEGLGSVDLEDPGGERSGQRRGLRKTCLAFPGLELGFPRLLRSRERPRFLCGPPFRILPNARSRLGTRRARAKPRHWRERALIPGESDR